MFEALGRGTYRRRWWVIAAAVAFLTFAGVWGTGVFGSLTGAGFDDPGSDSYRAARTAAAELGRDDADVIVLYRSADRTVDDPAFRQAVTGTLDALPTDVVERTTTFYGTGAPQLVSADRRSTYAVLGLRGDEDQRTEGLEAIEDRLAAPGLQTSIGGITTLNRDITERISEDIARAETLSIPVLMVLLVVIFGSVVGGQPAAGDRGHRDPRRVHGAAGLHAGHRRVGVLDQRHHDPRARPGDRLRPVHGEPVPGGAGARAEHRGRGGPDDGDRGPHGRDIRADRGDRAGRAADLPAGVPALDGLRRDGRGAGRDGGRADAAAGAAVGARAAGGRAVGAPAALAARPAGPPAGRGRSRRLGPDRAQRHAPPGALRGEHRGAAARAGAAVPAGRVRRGGRAGAAGGHREPGGGGDRRPRLRPQRGQPDRGRGDPAGPGRLDGRTRGARLLGRPPPGPSPA